MDYLSSQGIYKGERQLSVEDLREGMVLARPLYSSGGRFLLPHRTTLTNSHVQKLKMLQENNPFLEMIYVEAK
ncbi:MAG: hypothetical protein FJ117_21435 [Deltaproteobacteria bacterium]|nr:hypothetical protein [Deltaproteobacteria bacterium]